MRTRYAAPIVLVLATLAGGLWWACRAMGPAAPAALPRAAPAVPPAARPQPSVDLAQAVAPAPEPPAQTESAPDTPALDSAPPSEPDPAILGEWAPPHPTSWLDLARAQAEEGASRIARIELPLTPRRSATMVVDGFQPVGEDAGVFTGAVEGYPGTTVVLSYVGRAQSGVVLIPTEHRAYNFRAGDDGLVRVTELDTSKAPGCVEVYPPISDKS